VKVRSISDLQLSTSQQHAQHQARQPGERKKQLGKAAQWSMHAQPLAPNLSSDPDVLTQNSLHMVIV